MHTRPRIGVVVVVVALSVAATMGQPVDRFIDPLVTDPDIDAVDLPNANGASPYHYAVSLDAQPADALPGAGLLFLWLPGSGGAGTQYQELSRTAAALGYDVLSLTYDNWPPVNVITTQNPDPELPELIRRERLFGEAATEAVDVDEANSVVNRAVKAIEYLIATGGGERWAQYLRAFDGRPGGELEWSRIVVGGHSQGSGHAVYLSKEFLVHGTLILAGPGDFVQGFGTAPWVTEPGVTPENRGFAFTHADDQTAAGFFANQRILGLDRYGPLQNVDGRPEADLWSHMLTSTMPIDNGKPHSAVAVDGLLPLDDSGANVYEPAWTYLLRALAEQRRPGCTASDLAQPFGVLNASDINVFVDSFLNTAPRADLAPPMGIWNSSDINAFVAAFLAGCP